MEQKKENTRKESGTIRGTVRRYSDQSFDFTPFGKGEPVYQEQHKYKNGVTVATTRGANPKKVVRLEVAAGEPDLYHACVEKLDEALPAATVVPLRKKRTLRTLMTEGGASVTLDEATGLIRMEAEINLGRTPNYKNQLFNLFNLMNQCLAINETLLKRVAPAHAKNLKD